MADKSKTPTKRFRVIEEAETKADPDDMLPFGDLVSEKLNPQFAKIGGAVGRADELEYLHEAKTFIKTGIYEFDEILSRGNGIPCGRFIEVFSPESVGKSAMCEFLIGRFKHLNGTSHYIDTEQTIDYSHLACYGVKKGDFMMPDLPDLEAVWDYVVGVVKLLEIRNAEREKRKLSPEPPNLVVLDSLAATAARAELKEKEHDDSHVGEQARANSKGVRKTLRAFSASDVVFLCVNQLRDKIGAQGYGPKTDTPGGRALKYAYSIRMKLAKIETLKKGDRPVGHIIEVTTTKNKHAPMGQKCQIVLSYLRGIDVNWSNFLWFQKHRIIVAKGTAGYAFRGSDERFRRSEFGDFCARNKSLVASTVQECLEKDRSTFTNEMVSSEDGAEAE